MIGGPAYPFAGGGVGNAVDEETGRPETTTPVHRESSSSLLESLLHEEPDDNDDDEPYYYTGSSEELMGGGGGGGGGVGNHRCTDAAAVVHASSSFDEESLLAALLLHEDDDEEEVPQHHVSGPASASRSNNMDRSAANDDDDMSSRSSFGIVWESSPGPAVSGGGGGSPVLPDNDSSDVLSYRDDDDDHDSLLRAAALVPFHNNNDNHNGDATELAATTTARGSSSTSSFTARERLVLLIALACVLIVFPAMLIPELLREKTRFPRCRPSDQRECDDLDSTTASSSSSCVPDGLSTTYVCCPDDLVTAVAAATDLGPDVLDDYYYDDEQPLFRPVCGRVPARARCDQMDSLCASGYCIGGTCAARALRRLEPCDHDRHCESPLMCQQRAYTETKTVCCAGSSSDGVGGDGICQDMPLGNPCATMYHCESRLCILSTCAASKLTDSEQCEKDDDCLSGSCAADAVGSSKKICCRQAFPAVGESTSSLSRVCGDRPTNTACGDTNAICSSGYCINKVCSARQLARGQECTENADCASGGCALVDAADFTQSPVCCDDSNTVSVYNAGTTHWVCGDRPRGAFCGNFDSICRSSICINDYCAVSRSKDMDTCRDHQDCENGVCSLSSTKEGASLICCPNGLTTTGRLSDGVTVTVCAGMPVGTPCGNDDTVCESSFCIETTCAAHGLETNQLCQEGGDCKSKACGLRTANTTWGDVCCETSGAVMGNAVSTTLGAEYRTLCAAQPNGTFCNTNNEMCASGLCIDGYCANETLKDLNLCSEGPDCENHSCALASANASASSICCPNGTNTSGSLNVDGYYVYDLLFCGDMPDGTYCGDFSSICASGFCINQICAPGIEMFDPCGESNDCISGACGLEEANVTATTICCNGTAVATGMVWGDSSLGHTVCANRPVGTYCDTINEMCTSGLCINGYCVNEALADFSPCSEGPDCENHSCALASANASASSICCPNGTITSGSLNVDEHYVYDLLFCGDMPDGTYCGDVSSICASGFCINQTCAPGIAIFEPCGESNHCVSGACALEEANATSATICCNGATTTTGMVWGNHCVSGACALEEANATSATICCNGTTTTTGMVWGNSLSYQTVCANRPLGTFCDTINEMCSSGLCINGYCVNEALADFSPCLEGSDCVHGICSLSAANASAPEICCPYGQTTTNYSDSVFYGDVPDVYCGGMTDGTYCGDIPSICASGFCIDQMCAPGTESLERCSESSDCKSGACGRLQARVKSPTVCCEESSGSLTGPIVDGNTTSGSALLCAGRPLGTFCNEMDSMCTSGLCIGGFCSEEALADGEQCQDGTDCKNGACGLRLADDKSPRICCPGGASITAWSAQGTYDMVCSAMPVGTFCRDLNNVCSSGFCVNQTCATDRLAELASCTGASDCQSGVCEQAFADFSAPKVCCPISAASFVYDQTDNGHYVCSQMPDGSRCVGGDTCQSGLCSNQSCLALGG